MWLGWWMWDNMFAPQGRWLATLVMVLGNWDDQDVCVMQMDSKHVEVLIQIWRSNLVWARVSIRFLLMSFGLILVLFCLLIQTNPYLILYSFSLSFSHYEKLHPGLLAFGISGTRQIIYKNTPHLVWWFCFFQNVKVFYC